MFLNTGFGGVDISLKTCVYRDDCWESDRNSADNRNPATGGHQIAANYDLALGVY